MLFISQLYSVVFRWCFIILCNMVLTWLCLNCNQSTQDAALQITTQISKRHPVKFEIRKLVHQQPNLLLEKIWTRRFELLLSSFPTFDKIQVRLWVTRYLLYLFAIYISTCEFLSQTKHVAPLQSYSNNIALTWGLLS